MQEFARDDINCTVMCVGHNRGWEEAASLFTRKEVVLATATAALLQVQAATWQEAFQDSVIWELVGVVTPNGMLPPKAGLACVESA